MRQQRGVVPMAPLERFPIVLNRDKERSVGVRSHARAAAGSGSPASASCRGSGHADQWCIGDAAELQAIAPCVILGSSNVAQAHQPDEYLDIAALTAATPVFMTMAERVARRWVDAHESSTRN